MTKLQMCSVCKSPHFQCKVDTTERGRLFDCPVCGKYAETLCSPEIRVPYYLCSGVIRNHYASTGETFELKRGIFDSMNKLMAASPVAIPDDMDIPAKADLILRYLRNETTYPGQQIRMETDRDYAIAFCRNQEEFTFCIAYLQKRHLVEHKDIPGSLAYQITAEGWAYLKGVGIETEDQGFIAMAFRLDESDELFAKGLYVGIAKAGYDPMRSGSKEHNNRIEDQIMADIRRSRFAVADLTGKNAGAYFEAGFALGLGKPVIWTCKQSEIDVHGGVHFDTRQYNIVPWAPGEYADLADRLAVRIEATIGRGSSLTQSTDTALEN